MNPLEIFKLLRIPDIQGIYLRLHSIFYVPFDIVKYKNNSPTNRMMKRCKVMFEGCNIDIFSVNIFKSNFINLINERYEFDGGAMKILLFFFIID